MLNLLKSELAEITGDSGERYRFTFTRFSADRFQKFRLYQMIGRRYAIDAAGVTDAQLTAIFDRIERRLQTTTKDDEAFSLAIVAQMWARIASSITKVEAWQDEGWVEMPLPDELKTPESFRETFDEEWINLFSEASITVNSRFFKRLEPTEQDKKKDDESIASSVTALTNSPEQSTTTQKTRRRRQSGS